MNSAINSMRTAEHRSCKLIRINTFLKVTQYATTLLLAAGSLLQTPGSTRKCFSGCFLSRALVEPTVGTLRYWHKRISEHTFSRDQQVVLSSKREPAETALQVMDAHLATRGFFVGEETTLADVTFYAYAHLAPVGGFDLTR